MKNCACARRTDIYFLSSESPQLTVLTGQPEITRDDLKHMVAVTGRISGRDIGSVISASQAGAESSRTRAEGVYYNLGGLYAEQQKAFAGLVAVFLAAVALVFLLLLFLYESFRVACRHACHHAIRAFGSLCRAVADGHGNEYIVDDGHDHDRRHRHGSGDILLFGIRRS